MITEYQDSRVVRIKNEHGDEVEIELLQFPAYYKVTATICQDSSPYKDCIGIGVDDNNKNSALRKALQELYLDAYGRSSSLLFSRRVLNKLLCEFNYF
ncbi:hypothetical protein [Bacillus sp. AG4(2022)]|uniref:hypothetical protein n=1 Tax=Bacillus sp. AG4(2022) TaxID=2962594 RepID=UPI0028828A95|nr:hypothetical protein [Bacillus sp. AG4(2022)]MDT0160679.1 hypothetical protein [Bacillus sp. AG4(2022)]